MLRSKELGSPILVPVGGGEIDVYAMARFCRRVSIQASILVLNVEQGTSVLAFPPRTTSDAMADSQASLLAEAVSTLDIALMPMVVVGHGDGADRACDLLVRQGSLFAAGILLRPSASQKIRRWPSLAGLNVLLAMSSSAERFRSARGLAISLAEAGAEVVCEKVVPRKTPGSRDAAIARVFVATLFGA